MHTFVLARRALGASFLTFTVHAAYAVPRPAATPPSPRASCAEVLEPHQIFVRQVLAQFARPTDWTARIETIGSVAPGVSTVEMRATNWRHPGIAVEVDVRYRTNDGFVLGTEIKAAADPNATELDTALPYPKVDSLIDRDMVLRRARELHAMDATQSRLARLFTPGRSFYIFAEYEVRGRTRTEDSGARRLIFAIRPNRTVETIL